MIDRQLTFPHVERRQYPMSFLSNVVIELSYAPMPDFSDWAQSALKLFDGEDCEINFVEDAEIMVVKSPHFQFHIGEDRCSLAFNPVDYIGFDRIIELLQHNEKFFEECCLNRIRSIELTKANCFPGHPVENGLPEAGIMGLVFSDKLIPQNRSMSPLELFSVANLTETTLTIDHQELHIVHGFTSSKNDIKRLLGILTLGVKDPRSCAWSTCVKRLQAMNNLLFDVFHWCVSPETLATMSEE